ncbi:MAG: zinc ribbon domain-containing protein [Actinobacteria bacterium]|nr:zinc ribbon domain-containing protein [Actinomycetota bacterium]
MSPLFRWRADHTDGVAARRPHAGLLRRERRALARAREDTLRDLGGLLVEMYRRGGFRDDLLAERASVVVGIDGRLAEIDELLHAQGNTPRCVCGAPILRGSHFCPNCGRDVRHGSAQPEPDQAAGPVSEETVIESAPED